VSVTQSSTARPGIARADRQNVNSAETSLSLADAGFGLGRAFEVEDQRSNIAIVAAEMLGERRQSGTIAAHQRKSTSFLAKGFAHGATRGAACADYHASGQASINANAASQRFTHDRQLPTMG
jgi:hypothetical protein